MMVLLKENWPQVFLFLSFSRDRHYHQIDMRCSSGLTEIGESKLQSGWEGWMGMAADCQCEFRSFSPESQLWLMDEMRVMIIIYLFPAPPSSICPS